MRLMEVGTASRAWLRSSCSGSGGGQRWESGEARLRWQSVHWGVRVAASAGEAAGRPGARARGRWLSGTEVVRHGHSQYNAATALHFCAPLALKQAVQRRRARALAPPAGDPHTHMCQRGQRCELRCCCGHRLLLRGLHGGRGGLQVPRLNQRVMVEQGELLLAELFFAAHPARCRSQWHEL